MSTVQERIGGRPVIVAIIGIWPAMLLGSISVATLIWVFKHPLTAPYQDQIFDQLRFFRAAPHFLTLFYYLISAHNEHRITTTRFVFMIDDYLFHGRNITQIAATNFLQTASAALASFYIMLHNKIKLVSTESLFLFFVIFGLFINPNLLYTLVMPFQVEHAIMGLLVVISGILLGNASTRGRKFGDQSRAVVALIVLALIGTFTLGNAPAILIAAGTVAVILRWEFRLSATLWALAIVHTLVVLATDTPVGSPSFEPFSILKFSLIYWGSPFMRFEAWPAGYITWWYSGYLAALFGSVVLATAIGFATLRLIKPGLGGRVAVFGFTILVVVLVTGLAAAHSRTQFGVMEAANRKYASFAALGWLGSVAVIAGVLRERLPSAVRIDVFVFATLLAVLLPLSAVGYARETRIWQSMIDSDTESAIAEFLHINDRGKLLYLYSTEAGVAEYIGYAETWKLNVFADYPFHWGDDAAVFLAGLASTTCRAEVQTLSPVPPSDLSNIFPSSSGIPETMSGWTWMDYDHAPAKTVIAVDSRNTIVGLGATTRTSNRAEEWMGQKFDQNLGWFGFARVLVPPPLRFYALSNDGKAECPLGTIGDVR